MELWAILHRCRTPLPKSTSRTDALGCRARMLAKGLIMNIFYRPLYQSDITEFLTELKAKNPELEAGQRQGRELLWDKPVDREAWREYRAAQVTQKPYVYQTESKE